MDFDTAFDRVLGAEGGYTWDARDVGGETNWGISKRAYPDLNIRALSRDDAKVIYRRDYWKRACADDYDGAIGFQLFDAAVNSGIGNAIRFLQRAVGVPDDGVVGPITVAAIKKMSVPDVVARFNAERLYFLTTLSTWPAFGKGWARRIAANLKYASDDT